MFENLNVFRMAHAMAVHAGQKQAIAAENVANSDTPGFKARDIAAFADTYETANSMSGAFTLKATRESHLNGISSGQQAEPFEDPNGIASPNGNTVSLENEMLKSLNAKRQHDRALAIYSSSMKVLRTTFSRS